MTMVSQLLLGVAAQSFIHWGSMRYSYWHVVRTNTQTTSFSLSSSSLLPLSKGTVFRELFSSQTNPSNFLVWPVGLQGSAGCKVKKKGKSENRQSNRGDTNPLKPTGLGKLPMARSFWVLRTCSGLHSYPCFPEPQPARRWHSLWGCTFLLQKRVSHPKEEHMQNLPVPPNSDSVTTNCSRCFVWISLLKVGSGIQLVPQSEHNKIKCLHSPVTIRT